jgi:3',5'-cyclic AMP phosphodiesterase CpdA
VSRILHVSDLHFGRHAVPDQIEAIEALARSGRFDLVAVSGDLTQRARVGEFLRARVFLRDVAHAARVIVVPGNHDVCWWGSPLHVRGADPLYAPWRRWLSPELEPVVHVDGITAVGLNTAQGISRRTLTTRLRDLSVIGDLRREQVAHATRAFAAAPADDLKVVVMHHNPVRGELSQRHGLKHTKRVLEWLADAGAEVVLCGHDHQEAVHLVDHTARGVIVATAGTVSTRSRGGRPGSVNVVTSTPTEIEVAAWIWTGTTFQPGPVKVYERHAVVG